MLVGDFFEFADPAGPFDLGYDYTCGSHSSTTSYADKCSYWQEASLQGVHVLRDSIGKRLVAGCL